MMNIAEPVPMSFIVETVAVIFAIIGIGILMVKNAKRQKERE